MPPPLLHTRSGNAVYDAPSTPSSNGFTSPYTTPQGSPSKSKMPPGARDLPNVFDTAMKLAPSSPTKLGRHQLSPNSPNKGGIQVYDDEFGQNITDKENSIIPGSPLRKSNKENAPPGGRLGKEGSSTPNQAAVSRQEPYQSKETQDNSGHHKYSLTRGLTSEEAEKLQLPKVKRLANVTQLCQYNSHTFQNSINHYSDFLDYYFDLLSYVHSRQNRQAQFDAQYPPPPDTPIDEHNSMKHKYLGRERANLRKRRTRLRQGDFQILTQVGQGGYGQVFLASKKDTKEVCALKVMSKKLLFKLDEVRHILTERDILTAAKSEWLVKLLYAFQDETSIYLAMVKSLLFLMNLHESNHATRSTSLEVISVRY